MQNTKHPAKDRSRLGALRARTAQAVALLVGASLLGACSLLPIGPGASSEPTTPPSPSASPSSNVPEVTNPLDASTVAADPCSALTATDVEELELDPEGRRRTGAVGEECSWNNEDILIGALTVMAYDTDEGLAAIYRQEDTAAQFEPTEVMGYPGVIADAVSEAGSRTAKGRCLLYLGVSDQDVLVMFALFDRGPDVERPCEVAADLARRTLTNLS